MKDPKKQEAGRKGAEARRQKTEMLKAELAATKEAIFQENNRVNAVDTKTSKTHVSSEPKATMYGDGWGMGIGLAVVAGVVLFAVRPFAKQMADSANPKEQEVYFPTESSKPVHTASSQPAFGME